MWSDGVIMGSTKPKRIDLYCKNVNRRNKVLFNVVVAQEMPKLNRRFSLSELCYRFESRLNRYLALRCKPHHNACDGGCRTVARSMPRKDGRGLEGTNGSIGSQFTFPERDYFASLTRPLLMISFLGGPRKVNLLTV